MRRKDIHDKLSNQPRVAGDMETDRTADWAGKKARSGANRQAAAAAGDRVGRRAFMRAASVGALGAGTVAALPALAGPAFGASEGLMDAGVGMHASLTTMSMLSVATISQHLVTCGVGAMGLDTKMVRDLMPQFEAIAPPLPILEGSTGPFTMLMYSLSVDTYQVDRAGGMIQATGRMRSITEIADLVIEDVEHDYVATGKDGRDRGVDEFAVHYRTPFWTFPNNPLATPSRRIDGWSMFGGEMLIGEINVRR